MSIPDEAVEAAAKAVHDEFCRDQYHAGHIGPACYDYKVEARTVLETAAPYMFRDVMEKVRKDLFEMSNERDLTTQARAAYRDASRAIREVICAGAGPHEETIVTNPYRSQA